MRVEFCQSQNALLSWPPAIDDYGIVVSLEKSELSVWFEELVRTRYGTMKSLARVAKRGAGALTRSAAQTGSAGLEPLLRLAADLGESPSKVLAIAKKSEMDALIRRLYGRPSAILPADVQAVVDFLMADEPSLKSAQAGMIAHAKLLSTLGQSTGRGHEGSAETPKGVHGTRAKGGSRKRKEKRDDD